MRVSRALVAATALAMCSAASLRAAESHAPAPGHDAPDAHAAQPVSDLVIATQRAMLAVSTLGAGFGPQAPRDIDTPFGMNTNAFQPAPPYTRMNLCNIHFHAGAEHRGGEFTTYAGNGDGHGYGSGYLYSGPLSDAELAPVPYAIGAGEHGSLKPGDTIEQHFVHTTAQITPGPTLGSCLSDTLKNPQLRVETVVFVIVNDDGAADLTEINRVVQQDGLWQAPNLPDTLGAPVDYAGSTTGPGYNEVGSPFQVSWSVRPKVMKVSARSVAAWLSQNVFDEDHAHGVRNLVVNPELLSPIGD